MNADFERGGWGRMREEFRNLLILGFDDFIDLRRKGKLGIL